jgi:hypothetical protein
MTGSTMGAMGAWVPPTQTTHMYNHMGTYPTYPTPQLHTHNLPTSYTKSPFNTYPTPTTPTHTLDLAKMPAGNMANIVKAAKNAGHAPHTPVDLRLYMLASPHVEPGRVLARVAEFYRVAEVLLHPPVAPVSVAVGAGTAGVGVGAAVGVGGGVKVQFSGKGRGGGGGGSGSNSDDGDEGYRGEEYTEEQREREEGWERYVPGYEEEKRLLGKQDGDEGDRGRDRGRGKYPRLGTGAGAGGAGGGVGAGVGAGAVGEMDSAKEIADDNMGHKLLRGMGWAGGGLGADAGGIVEPITASAAAAGARGGIGTGTGTGKGTGGATLQDGKVDYSSYRSQLSSDYHAKIVDRR